MVIEYGHVTVRVLVTCHSFSDENVCSRVPNEGNSIFDQPNLFIIMLTNSKLKRLAYIFRSIWLKTCSQISHSESDVNVSNHTPKDISSTIVSMVHTVLLSIIQPLICHWWKFFQKIGTKLTEN